MNKMSPYPVSALADKVLLQITCGWSHSVALTGEWVADCACGAACVLPPSCVCACPRFLLLVVELMVCMA